MNCNISITGVFRIIIYRGGKLEMVVSLYAKKAAFLKRTFLKTRTNVLIWKAMKKIREKETNGYKTAG